MPESIRYGKALYYPYINFSNLKWLKTAALFYESLGRIVPQGYHDFTDKHITDQFNAHEAFVKDIFPTYESLSTGLNFLKFFERELADEAKRANYLKKIGWAVRSEKPYVIYDNKISAIVKTKLIELGYLPEGSISDTIKLDPVIGATYMTFLANEIAKAEVLPVVTDDPVFQPILSNAQLFNEKAEDTPGISDIGYALGKMVIQCAVPEGIENIPVKKIIKFRKEHRPEQQNFYKAINGLVKDLEKINKETKLQEILDDKKTEVDRAVTSLNDALRSIKFSSKTVLLGVSIPAAGAFFGPVGAAVGTVAVVTGNVVSQKMEIKKTKSANPYAYVLSLKNNLKSETFLEQLVHGKIFF